MGSTKTRRQCWSLLGSSPLPDPVPAWSIHVKWEDLGWGNPDHPLSLLFNGDDKPWRVPYQFESEVRFPWEGRWESMQSGLAILLLVQVVVEAVNELPCCREAGEEAPQGRE